MDFGGGFEKGMFVDLKEDVICPICDKVANKPYCCVNQVDFDHSHIYCKDCIILFVQETKKCPCCNKDATYSENAVVGTNSIVANNFAKKYIDCLKTRCKCFSDTGNYCGWTGSFAEQRVGECLYVLPK
jgi:hypothetical protein